MSEHLNMTLAKHKDRHQDGLHQLDRVKVVQMPAHFQAFWPLQLLTGARIPEILLPVGDVQHHQVLLDTSLYVNI